MKPTLLPLLPLSLLALAAGPGCVDRQAQDVAKQTSEIVTNPVKTVTAERPRAQTLEETVDVSGDVTTSADVQASFKTGGRLAAVAVNDGDRVTEGQPLASLDTSTLLPAVQQAQAQVATTRAGLQQAISNARLNPAKTAAGVRQAQAQVRSARAALTKALRGARPEERAQAQAQLASARSARDTTRKDRDRYRALVKEGAISQQRLDQAQNAYETALAGFNTATQTLATLTNGTRSEDVSVAREAVRQAEGALATARANQSLDVTYRDQVEAARGQVEAAQAGLRLATQNLADAQLKAPISGTILGKPLRPGSVVAPGTPVARIIGEGGVYFEGQVPSARLATIQAGQEVRARIDAIPGKLFAGRIASISPQGEATGRLFVARIVFEGGAPGVRPGMFARGTIVVKRDPNALTLPTSALLTDGPKRFVYVNDGGKAKRKDVTLGIVVGDRTQVLGLSATDEVIVQGGSGLVEGDKVRTEAPSANSQRSGGSATGGGGANAAPDAAPGASSAGASSAGASSAGASSAGGPSGGAPSSSPAAPGGGSPGGPSAGGSSSAGSGGR